LPLLRAFFELLFGILHTEAIAQSCHVNEEDSSGSSGDAKNEKRGRISPTWKDTSLQERNFKGVLWIVAREETLSATTYE